MLLRLSVSAALALALLMAVISFGSRAIREGARALVPEAAPIDMPLQISGPAGRRGGQVTRLRSFLSIGPAERLAEAFERSDIRFLAIHGATPSVPGVTAPETGFDSAQLLVIPGTTDAPISDEHAALLARAERYARAYNALLLRHAAAPPGERP